MQTVPFRVDAVAFREGESWIAHGVDFDIAAHGATLTELSHAFMRAIVHNVIVAEHLGKDPRTSIPPAPAHFREMFDSAEMVVGPVPGRPDEACMTPTDISMRIAEHA